MKVLRYLLLPVVPIYWFVTKLRNWCFDLGIFQSKSYDFPVICIGNLSVGGTGKTPMTEYLIEQLKGNYKLATLSRGYGRSTKGFLLADANSSAANLGDEPFQLYTKFKDDIVVSVDEKRVHGIDTLMSTIKDIDMVLLDDAFQHRHVKAGFNILLTSHDQLYVNDMCLPTGNLRESISGASRADAIIVTKCPVGITDSDKSKITALLNPKPQQEVYFSRISYSEMALNSDTEKGLSDFKDSKFTLITGIANPKPLVSHLEALGLAFDHLSYSDHHKFSDTEIKTIKSRGLILTTEKDYTRLAPHFETEDALFYLPIRTIIDRKADFEAQINAFIHSY